MPDYFFVRLEQHRPAWPDLLVSAFFSRYIKYKYELARRG
jgi:hypothetical protein